MIKLAEAKPVKILSSIENDFKVTVSEIEKAITSKTKMLIFSSPCNPSGTVYSKRELESIAKMLEKYPNIYVVADEIYEHINFDEKHFSIGSIASMKEKTITVNGVSKGFRNDWLESWFYWSTTMGCKCMQQNTGPGNICNMCNSSKSYTRGHAQIQEKQQKKCVILS